MRALSIIISEELLEKVKQQSEIEERSVSQIIRLILKTHFDKQDFQEKKQ